MRINKPYTTIKRNGKVKFYNDNAESITQGKAVTMLLNQLHEINDYVLNIRHECDKFEGDVEAKRVYKEHVALAHKGLSGMRQILVAYFH